jgi:PleD family two-component response regulator
MIVGSHETFILWAGSVYPGQGLNAGSLSRAMSASIKTFETGGTLLVVDDEASVRKRLRRIFEGAGHHVLTASDGPGALRLLHKEHCDLVVLDAEMPGVDGLALCRLLRAQAATKQLPVIMLS